MKANFEERVTFQLDSITKSIEKLATKDELNASTAKLVTKDKFDDAVLKLATRVELRTALLKLPTRIQMDSAIGSLAFATKKGFDEVHKRIDCLETKIETMDSRLTNQLDQIYLHYPTKQDFVLLNGRVKKIEEKIAA